MCYPCLLPHRFSSASQSVPYSVPVAEHDSCSRRSIGAVTWSAPGRRCYRWPGLASRPSPSRRGAALPTYVWSLTRSDYSIGSDSKQGGSPTGKGTRLPCFGAAMVLTRMNRHAHAAHTVTGSVPWRPRDPILSYATRAPLSRSTCASLVHLHFMRVP